ncbi:unc-112-related protein isoform X1 [Ctenocephalides felis]|uniref:unc-112-related protein isoform X1 n=1 Tax=Ctenocephalides felis TaxID=7515 RepID=UPI000E6E50E6|nr:unc-112-related protein isoform X1 [Ctenocephalides felis]
MIGSDGYIDGSWKLKVFVTDLGVERELRVKGDLHIGGVLLRLVEDLGIAIDWSDHALWWPAKNRWLTRTRSTLDQCGVQGDSLLHLTPMHKNLRVQLPDLRYLDLRVDFSVQTFSAVVALCRDLDIRHPEELSFCKPLEPQHLKKNFQDLPRKKHEQNGTVGNGHLPLDTNTFIAESPRGSNGSLNNGDSRLMCAPVTPQRSAVSPPPRHTPISSPTTPAQWPYFNGALNGTTSPTGNESLGISLASSPATPSHEARSKMLRPKTLVERARLNVGWLDSSLSIMEQGVRENETLCLRFKFCTIFDLNPKYDSVRINQLYEQARWQLLNEEVDCTEEEMLMFAALQVQVGMQAHLPQPNLDTTDATSPGEDDIDAALSELQITLEGPTGISNSSDITQVPELSDYLRFLKPKRFLPSSYKRYWFTCRDLHLFLYKTKGDSNPALHINLRGCEALPDVNISAGKFGIKLSVPNKEDGMTEMWIRCDNETQYAKWMAACRLGSKGRSLADSSYETEVVGIEAFLAMQRPAPQPVLNPQDLDISVEDYVAPRFTKKLKGKLTQRILEAHANVTDLNLIEAKLRYIKAWQSLPDHGVTLFVVKFMGHKKEELLGVASNRLMKMDINTGYLIKTWRYNTMKAWNVNWEVKHMMVQFEEENIIFSCLSADCKVIHEFIGGYIFMSMRSKDANQQLNQEMFHKLTGGWS